MSFTPKDSAINVTPEIAEQLKTANAEEIKSIMRQAMLDQKLATAPDFWHPEDLEPTELSTHANNRSKTVTVNGKTYTISGSTEQELADAELRLFREIMNPQQPVQQPQQRDDLGRFTPIEDPVLTGAVEGYLRNRGINPEDLQEVAGQGYKARWSDSAARFRERHPEWDNFASEENMRRLGEKVFELGLDDSPTPESLEAAYVALARENALTDNPNVALARQIGSMDNIEDIRALSRQILGQPSSGFFSR